MHPMDDSATTPRIADLDSEEAGVRLGEWMQDPRRARWRRARTGLAALALLVTVGALLRISWGAAGVRPPNMTQTGDLAVIDSNVTYGTLQVNGASYAMHPGLHITLQPGINHLTLDVPPFNPIHCTLIEPLKTGDDRCVTGYSIYEETGYVPVVTLTVNETDLPSAVQQTLHRDLARSLPNIVVQTTLSAGEWYGTGALATDGLPRLRRATAPALAQLQAALGTSGTLPCGALTCPMTLGAVVQTQVSQFWQIQVPVSPAWVITDLQTGSTQRYPLPSLYSSGADSVLTMDAFFDGRDWTFSDATQSTKVPAPTQQLAEMACDAGATILASKLPGIISFAPGTTSGAGCELIFTNNPGGTNAPPLIAHFIVRAGAVLAEDATAKRLLPDIPPATPAEIAAVQG